ncbi:MotA/TolQ/ExbB proton channel family protein [Neptunicella sp. SCSIO 80796]|uniref:MotA/TolQ/ExbB proton channel family protein n=1 Tax=Neptunicella plasticusilytica TaxID=3117012 RepID=UPI003A4E4F0C
MKITSLIIISISLFCSTSVFSQQKVQASLLADINSAQQNLQRTQKNIASQRTKLASQLRNMQDKVLSLREKTAVARRLADENTLGLNQLEKRLDGWRQQHQYQQNLLNRFLRQQQQGSSAGDTGYQQVLKIADAMQAQFSPRWQQQSVIQSSGQIQPAQVLNLGPLNWFVNDEQAGLLEATDNGFRTALEFDGSQRNALFDLHQSGQGNLTFDPSNSKAVAMAQHQESALEHVSKGGLWAIPILFFALFALIIAIAKSWQLLRVPKIQAFSSIKLQQLLTHKDGIAATAGTRGTQKALLQIAHSESNINHRDDLLFNCLQNSKFKLERWLGAIAVVASIAPLLGLLGTVSGMIETFKMMTLFGSGDPEVVSGGIAQALITTELGLVVAIPALILNALLSRRAKTYYQQLESFAVQISQLSGENVKPLHQPVAEQAKRASA